MLILTTFGRPGYLRRAMEAGASGFLLKDAPAHHLAAAIRRVVDGERVVDPALAAEALAEGPNPLTAREREVLADGGGRGDGGGGGGPAPPVARHGAQPPVHRHPEAGRPDAGRGGGGGEGEGVAVRR